METIAPLFKVSLTNAGGLGLFDLSSCPQATKVNSVRENNNTDFMFFIFKSDYEN
jgi:hypothetical protein